MLRLTEGGLVYSIGITLLCLREFTAEDSGWTATRNAVTPQMPHEIIIPQWKARSGNDKHPPRAELRVTAEGRNFIVDVEKNEDLFAPDYTETHYTKIGTAQTISLNKTDHCFYHGRVRGIHKSSVVLSTCRGLR
ncbi:disintegrin and metalloproteinase domain-containing protein 19-like, partial [Python bivittatus]|uniref:Disintegrin and metalloproteinase domain-containing protein 19-like n=1 Tax=Python bivittatus TaxID=176946 RepID=A0A9F5N6Y6_PYTBI